MMMIVSFKKQNLLLVIKVLLQEGWMLIWMNLMI